MIGMFKSTSQSWITKSARNIKFLTRTRTSYSISTNFFTILSTIDSRIDLEVRAPKTNYLNTARGIRLMLPPKLHNIFTKLKTPMVQGMVNAPVSSLFCTTDLVAIALQWWRSWASSWLTILFFVTRYFMNFACQGIYSNTIMRSEFMYNCFNIEMKSWKFPSSILFFNV